MMKQAATIMPSLSSLSITSIGPNAQVSGVVIGSVPAALQVRYPAEALLGTREVLATAAPAKPTEVFRAAAPCSGRARRHFDGANCQLAARITTMLDPEAATLPRFVIRSVCRWFHQEGRAAFLRCPQVTTERRNPSDLDRAGAG